MSGDDKSKKYAGAPIGEKDKIIDLFNGSIQYTRSRIRSYWLNSAFLQGNQWLYWSSQTGRVEVRDTDPADDRMRAVINRIRSNQRLLLANATQRELTFEILPERSDAASLDGARVGEAWLQNRMQRQNWERIREQWVSMVWKGGVAALCVDWDEDHETPVLTPLTVAEFVVEPGASSANDALWWIKSQVFPPERVKAMFNMDKLPSADARTSSNALIYEAKDRSTSSLTSGSVNNSEPPLTRVLTYYQRPYKEDKGRVIVEVGGKRVFDGEWYFPWDDHLNLEVGIETVEDNNWWGTSYLDDVRRVQVVVNALWSIMLEHANNAGSVKEFVPSGMIEQYQQLLEEPGVKIPWPAGMEKPEWQKAPNPGNFIENLIDRAMLAIDDLMGVHDVTRGMAPPNIESGFGIQILAEKDASPTTRMINETARCFRAVAEMYLRLHATKGKDVSQKVRVDLGWDFETKDFSGKELAGQFDVQVPVDALIPRSRAAQQAFAMSALGSGLVQGVDQFFTLADFPGRRPLLEALQPDIGRARREIKGFVMGRAVIPATYDDHPVHITEHENFMKSERFDLMPPEQQDLVFEHVQAHKNMMAEAQAQDLAMQGMMGAAEAGTGEMPIPLGEGPPSTPLPSPEGLTPMEQLPLPMPEPIEAMPVVAPPDLPNFDGVDPVIEDAINRLTSNGGV